MKYKIINPNKKEIPWQEKPKGNNTPVWRYAANPIFKRNPQHDILRIFNSSVTEFGGKFVGVFRGETAVSVPSLYFGQSDDGIHWNLDKERIVLDGVNGEKSNYAYDPRLVQIGDTYYMVWCTDFCGGPSLAIAHTKDFKNYERLANGFLPCNRNGVLFPECIEGNYYMLSRPSDTGHTAFGDIYISESKDLVYWGNHKCLMKNFPNGESWSSLKIGGGPTPIKTSEGWLMIYHGVIGNCNGYVYSMGAALLDINEPSKVIARSRKFLLTPEEWYEERGFVPNVIFPCGALTASDGRIAIYYGAADTYLALAFTTIDEIIDFIYENNN